jgi:hypothetical protein
MLTYAIDLFQTFIRGIEHGLEGPEPFKETLGKWLGVPAGYCIAQQQFQKLIV